MGGHVTQFPHRSTAWSRPPPQGFHQARHDSTTHPRCMVSLSDVVPSSRNGAATSSGPSPSPLQTSSPWPWRKSLAHRTRLSTGVKKIVCFVRRRACSPNMSWSPRSRFLFLHVRHRRGQTQSKSKQVVVNNKQQCGARWITSRLLSAFRFSFQVPAHKKKSTKSGWNLAQGLDFEDFIDLQICESKMKSRLIECVNSSKNLWNLRNQD